MTFVLGFVRVVLEQRELELAANFAGDSGGCSRRAAAGSALNSGGRLAAKCLQTKNSACAMKRGSTSSTPFTESRGEVEAGREREGRGLGAMGFKEGACFCKPIRVEPREQPPVPAGKTARTGRLINCDTYQHTEGVSRG